MCFIDIMIKDITIYHYFHVYQPCQRSQGSLLRHPTLGEASTKKAPGNLKKNRHRSDFRGKGTTIFSYPYSTY